MITDAASQISSSSQSLAQGASEQAASLEQTSASTEEINSMARKSSENSRSAAGLVSQSQRRFVQTNQALEQMVAAMGEINTQSDKISKIIKAIDGIAFQTNILALNAAVQAARAGDPDHYRGIGESEDAGGRSEPGEPGAGAGHRADRQSDHADGAGDAEDGG